MNNDNAVRFLKIKKPKVNFRLFYFQLFDNL